MDKRCPASVYSRRWHLKNIEKKVGGIKNDTSEKGKIGMQAAKIVSKLMGQLTSSSSVVQRQAMRAGKAIIAGYKKK